MDSRVPSRCPNEIDVNAVQTIRLQSSSMSSSHNFWCSGTTREVRVKSISAWLPPHGLQNEQHRPILNQRLKCSIPVFHCLQRLHDLLFIYHSCISSRSRITLSNMFRNPLLRDGESEFKIPISTANSGVRERAISIG